MGTIRASHPSHIAKKKELINNQFLDGKRRIAADSKLSLYGVVSLYWVNSG